MVPAGHRAQGPGHGGGRDCQPEASPGGLGLVGQEALAVVAADAAQRDPLRGGHRVPAGGEGAAGRWQRTAGGQTKKWAPKKVGRNPLRSSGTTDQTGKWCCTANAVANWQMHSVMHSRQQVA